MYFVPKIVFLGYPIIHPTLLQDIIWDDYINLQTDTKRNILREALIFDKQLFIHQDPLYGETCIGIAVKNLHIDFLKSVNRNITDKSHFNNFFLAKEEYWTSLD